MTIAQRDLSAHEYWERSLARSRYRRALAASVRRNHKRRKGVSAVVAAATMAGPGTPMAFAAVSGNLRAEVAAETSSKRAIEIREGGLPLVLGSQGPLVAQVQKALEIPADGIFGPQTDIAVRRYQARAGLHVDGIVGPLTWASLVRAAKCGRRDQRAPAGEATAGARASRSGGAAGYAGGRLDARPVRVR